MRIGGVWMGVIAIVFGIRILILPNLLQWLVGICLIVIGVLAVTGKK